MLRKLNTIILIPIILLAITHLILMAGLLTYVLPFNPNYQYISFTLLTLLAIHAGICLILTAGRILKRSHKHKKYRRENKALVLQIISGILMLILVAVHMTAYGYTAADGSFVLRSPSLQYLITESLLALTIFVHCVISIPRLSLSLGIVRRTSGLKKVFAASTIVCLLCLLLAFYAYTGYYLPTVLGGLV